MEEVRKKCEALKRRPRRKFLLLVVRVCGPLVTQRIFFSANGVLFLNVSEYANVCSSHERRYSSTSKGEYKNLMDLKKTKKKKTLHHFVQECVVVVVVVVVDTDDDDEDEEALLKTSEESGKSSSVSSFCNNKVVVQNRYHLVSILVFFHLEKSGEKRET